MRSKKKIIAAAVSAFCFVQMMSITAYASGDVAGAVTSTWTTARAQVVSVVNNVVFPVIDVILAVLLFVKITLAYLDYRKHGQLEWTPIAIIFGCLIDQSADPECCYGNNYYNHSRVHTRLGCLFRG